MRSPRSKSRKHCSGYKFPLLICDPLGQSAGGRLRPTQKECKSRALVPIYRCAEAAPDGVGGPPNLIETVEFSVCLTSTPFCKKLMLNRFDSERKVSA